MASKFKKTLGKIAQFGLPILGGVLGGPGGAALGGAAGGLLSGEKGAVKQAAIGGLTGYGGAKALGVGGSGGSSNPFSFLSNIFGGQGGNPLTSIFGGGSGSGGGPGGGGNQGSSSSGFGASQLPQLPFLNTGSNQQSTAKSSFGLSGLGEGIKKNPLLLGLGTILGSQLIRSPKVPELPQSVIDFQNAARSGNPLQNQASAALSQQLGQPFEQLSAEEEAAINRQYDIAQEQELKQIDSLYKSLRPGTDPLSDSAYQKDIGRVRDRYATLRADSVAQNRRQVRNDFNTTRANQIAQAAGLSNQQLQQLAQLSQFDLDRQLSQLAITDRDRQTLRDYLLQLGGNLVSSQFETNPLLELFGAN